MKDEIKEILDRLEDSANNPIVNVPVMGGVSEPIDNSQCLEPNECKILLDYITNLQQKVEQYENPDDLTLFYMWLDEKAKDKMKALQEENEKLKERVQIGQNAFLSLNSKIDKAIEYINHAQNYGTMSQVMSHLKSYVNGDDLLDILKGDEK